VPGAINDQFSIDDHEGLVRIATTGTLVSQTEWSTRNNLFVLGQDGAALTEVGSVQGLAPGEQIYSTRFLGDRAYMVTFRQVDPLFVIDLSDPASPDVMAELKIPGFSEYMHPLGDGHLLTIGQDATQEGQVIGLALQIFDVQDPTAPALAHKYTFSGQDYGYSEAQYNHKAFTYYGALGLLAFPFTGWDENGMKSSLELFKIGVDTGIQKVGSIDHSAFFAQNEQGYCGGYYGVDVRRGLFIDEYVFSISYGGVIASHVADPASPVATLPLPQPEASYDYCGGYYE
jgi:uncharacterized secreted protein with C-terminal beta-propeller domain